ncbi:MAG: hypothetical protein ACREA2_07005 [Blastocatellia bacterium]
MKELGMVLAGLIIGGFLGWLTGIAQVFTARAGINRNSFILACDCEGVIVLKKIAIVISSMLLGIFGGAAVGWLIGRTIYFFKVELPYRDLHLPPGEFQAATCGLSTSIAITTLYLLIPAGIVLGSVIGFGVGMAQENSEHE